MLGREEPHCPVSSCLGNILLQVAWVGVGRIRILTASTVGRAATETESREKLQVGEGRVRGDLINNRNPQVMLRQGLSPGKSSMGNKERGPTRFIN